MSLAALCLLALVDATLIGHHAAIGINPLVDKRSYWRSAMLRGLAAGVVGLAAIALAGAVAFALSADRAALLADAHASARAMLAVLVPYAIAVLLALGLYCTPARPLANVLVLGPFTLLRMPALVTAVTLAIAARPRAPLIAVLAVALATTAALVPWLRRHPPAWPGAARIASEARAVRARTESDE